MKQPKILILDIETAPLKSAMWKLFDEQGGLPMLLSDWYMLSWSAKWYGEDKVYYMDQRSAKDVENDKRIVEALYKMMDQADIIIGHNIDKFDLKRINTRIQKHEIGVLIKGEDYRSVDTIKIAKKHFDFTSNSLEYLAKFLGCKNKKLKDRKFTGPKLWFKAMEQDKEAFDEMKAYNMQDVLTVEEVYDKLKKWDKSINFAVYNEGEHICSCGSENLRYKGLRATNSGVFKIYKCKDCGRPVKNKVNELTPEQKKKMREVK